MSERIAVELGNVQKTLFLPLWGRAFETRKQHRLLIDKTAVKIMDEVDYDFAEIAAGVSELNQIAWIMRSICVDEVVRAFLQRDPQASIVNIGCGLDTTFERIDNGKLLWYDLDLPDVIDLRRRLIHELVLMFSRPTRENHKANNPPPRRREHGESLGSWANSVSPPDGRRQRTLPGTARQSRCARGASAGGAGVNTDAHG